MVVLPFCLKVKSCIFPMRRYSTAPRGNHTALTPQAVSSPILSPNSRTFDSGQDTTTAQKLCLQGWTQSLQNLLYWRLSFSLKKNVHSERHFLLRFISRPYPGFLLRGGFVRASLFGTLPLSILQALPDGGFSPAWSCALRLGPSLVSPRGDRC